MIINNETNLFGIIGKPVKHSLSPYLHNNLFANYNVNGVYLAFETDDVENIVKGMKSFNVSGLSVTIPNKVSIIPFLDEIDNSAKIIGAVNTVINNHNKLRGYNTDIFGVVESFRTKNINCDDKKMLIIGSGGAARAVICGLLGNYRIAELNILGIESSEINNLIKLTQNFRGVYVNGYIINDIILKDKVASADLIVNASPIGMSPNIDISPVPIEYLKEEQIIFDVVYNPVKTKFLEYAEQKNCRTISGIDMFIYQAYKQFELFTGIAADINLVKKFILNKVSPLSSAEK